MSYQVLARKYRPKSFETLVGQEHVVRALTHALEQQRLHHAYLFTGTRGVGKTTLSRILAKSLNCEKGVTASPCGQCEACVAIDAGRAQHPLAGNKNRQGGEECLNKRAHGVAKANAGGDAESASDQVDSAWRDYLPDALAVLRTLREPDQRMAAAGDPAVWERMVLAAIKESKPERVVL